MQVKFEKCKFWIIDKKSIIGFKMPHQINICLYSVIVCLNEFFRNMNAYAINYLLLIILKK